MSSPIEQALARAQEAGLNLVEVNPMAKPPVCKIMDYGRFKYEEKKKANEAKKKQVVVKLKEVKLRPKTEEHDYETKVRHAREFLEEGNKAKITIMFRGREITHRELGSAILDDVVADLKDVAVVEQPPRMEGKADVHDHRAQRQGRAEGPRRAAPAPSAPDGEGEGGAQGHPPRRAAPARGPRVTAVPPAAPRPPRRRASAGPVVTPRAARAPRTAEPPKPTLKRRPPSIHECAGLTLGSRARYVPRPFPEGRHAQAEDPQRREEALPGEEERQGEARPRLRQALHVREDAGSEAPQPRHWSPGAAMDAKKVIKELFPYGAN